MLVAKLSYDDEDVEGSENVTILKKSYYYYKVFWFQLALIL